MGDMELLVRISCLDPVGLGLIRRDLRWDLVGIRIDICHIKFLNDGG
jgi:hypothetical protein